ncbi:MAG: PQQ-dependent sugar dehydrogenase [Ignavibacteriaceae bacterium]|nr:PQQ-dependent sugar dehydrogenase [Ignavibacteriaceae bacterium]
MIKMLLLFILVLQVTAFSQYSLQVAFPNLTFSSPVDIQTPDDDTDRMFVVSQSGLIYVFPNNKNVTSSKIFLNITDRVTSGGELGLLGLAFHPDYKNNGYFYVNYTAPNPRRSIVARYRVSQTNPDSADKNSELILLSYNQPYSNHNGGQNSFGPDGYLYVATGDGGSAGDPQNNAQNREVLLGKILRINVDSSAAGLNYSIPPDNPYKGNSQGYREEIYSYGMRNPWRFSFDPVTGWLWCADVGQGLWEEIDLIWNGGNYGWKILEGFQCYNAATCDTTNKIPPIFVYGHNSSGGYSVTGGYVYRGPNLPELTGKYIYGDYVSKRIWALSYDGVNPPVNEVLISSAGISLSTFGLDRYGEIYAADLTGGKIYKFNATAPVIAPTGLTASLNLMSDIELNWTDNALNETGYIIERRQGNNTFVVRDTISANTTVYIDSAISGLTQYSYRVKAFNSSGNSGYSNTVTILSYIPVELESFSASVAGSDAILQWITVSEINNSGFEIYRSIKNGWKRVGFVEGKGTTTELSIYRFDDRLPPFAEPTEVFYRLKQIDLNGEYTYTYPVMVKAGTTKKEYELLQNYPNPFNGATTIRFILAEKSGVRLVVSDLLGKEVAELIDEEREAGYHEVLWSGENVASGVYYAKLIATTSSKQEVHIDSKKMILIK